MAGGQAIDLASIGKKLDEATLRDMHRRKTGLLLQASVMMGAACGQCGEQALRQLEIYGAAIGLAFQVVDDILDVTRIPPCSARRLARTRMPTSRPMSACWAWSQRATWPMSFAPRPRPRWQPAGSWTRLAEPLADSVVERDS